MMLDLVVQSSIPEIGKRMRMDIASSNHLAAQEVQWAVCIQHRHPFMIRSEDRSQVQPRKSLVDENEEDGLPDR